MSNIKDKLIEIIRASGYGYFITHKDVDVEDCLKATADSIIENLPELLADSEWVKSPCKVGQDVWFIRYYDNKICEGKICLIINREIEPLFEITVCDKFGDRVGTIGQTDNIFYTKKEAETKLAELKGVKNDK